MQLIDYHNGIHAFDAGYVRHMLAAIHLVVDDGRAAFVDTGSNASLPHASLWLAGNAGTDSVIIDPVHFMPSQVFQVHGMPERSFIALGNPIEHSKGWMRAIAEPVNR